MDLKELRHLAETLQAVLTSAAIVVGGLWSYLLFVRKRQKYPRASLAHNISHRPLGDGYVLLSVRAGITNAGEVLLSIVSVETRLQQVLPPPSDLIKALKGGQDPIPEGRTEMDWPLLRSRLSDDKARELQIEPGESDSIQYDFMLDRSVRTVEIYTYIKNEKVRKRDVGWSVTSLYDIQPQRRQEEPSDR